MILTATIFCTDRLFFSCVWTLTAQRRSKEHPVNSPACLHRWLCSPLLCKVAGNLLGQHCSHQFVSLLPLHLQLLRPLSDQILQVGGVLLQHAQHAVNDVGLFPPGDVLELQQGKDGSETYQYKRGAAEKWPFSPFTCLKISSKVGLLSGSSLQACFTICITSSGASSTDTSGRHSGGGDLTLLIISARTQKTQQGTRLQEKQPHSITPAVQRWCVLLSNSFSGL